MSIDEIPVATIEAARDGRAEAAERLIAAAWPHAFRIAYSIVHERALAEDAAQEACAIVYRRIDRLREAAAFRVWFYRIVVREAMRTARYRLHAAAELPEYADASLGDANLRIDVLRALAKLSPAERATTVLHYYAALNSREIAAVMRIPDGSVRYYLMRARRSLERLLGDHRPKPRLASLGSHAL